MQETLESLIEMGLTQTEARLYLAGLPFDSVSVQDLGRHTDVKRPTIYHALGTLQEKGLVSERKDGNKTHFSMCSPEILHGLLERRREHIDEQSKKLDDLIPLLAQQRKTHKDGVSVVQYHGIEGMKLVMDIAFYCKSRRWDIIAPFNNFLREYDADYAKRYLNARKYHGITSRTLWEDNMRPNRKLTEEEIKERNPRLMPWVMHGKFKSMMILFDDKMAVFSSYEKLSAVLINSKDMHDMFTAIFEGLWEFSEAY